MRATIASLLVGIVIVILNDDILGLPWDYLSVIDHFIFRLTFIRIFSFCILGLVIITSSWIVLRVSSLGNTRHC
jgi:hypothetical protein